MDIKYTSTRNNRISLNASQAILKGLSDDGGLFVPSEFPKFTKSFKELSEMNYREVAFTVMKPFLNDFTDEELKDCINKAYDKKFDVEDMVSLKETDNNIYIELFHGATIAFKDMALSILPHLMTTSAKKNNIEDTIVILTATSGDTGKAAMAGFADVENTKIIVFYPKNGVSAIQEKQMLTQKGDNTSVVGIMGNFDDAQTGVKQMFNNTELKDRLKEKHYILSSANSINIGRLVPQIVYYVYAYTRLVGTGKIKEGDKVNITVPTGNFGNILAAFYAYRMGLPVNKLICASNENKVLYDFFQTGTYDKNRDFVLTTSPSMDILVSSNLERLLYHLTGSNSDLIKTFMENLNCKGKYIIGNDQRANFSVFESGFATENNVKSEIKRVYEKYGYVIDTHTAVASYVNSLFDDGSRVNLIASTASCYKFPVSVLKAIEDSKEDLKDDFKYIDRLKELSKVPEPKAVTEIRNAEIRHNRVCEVKDMQATVEDILK